MSKHAVIIGAGHNGLVCSAYLARAGFKVTILERRHIVGGAAVTEEFHEGFRNSVASYTVSLLHPQIIKDLHLYEHGLQILPRSINNYLPFADGRSFLSYPQLDKTCKSLSQFSTRDAENLPLYFNRLDEIVSVIKEIMLLTPPNIIESGLGDLVKIFNLSRLFRQLGKTQKRFLLRLFSISAAELLDDFFESDAIKALLGFDAIVGHYASPYSPGSAYVLLHHLVGEVHGISGVWGHAVGGMGAITEAMAKEAGRLGVTIKTEAEVTHIETSSGKAKTVYCQDGTVIPADIVIANVNPEVLFKQLLNSDDLSEDLIADIDHYKCQSGTFRMNVALDKLPQFSADMPDNSLQAGIIMASSLDYMDQAFTDARRHGWSKKPVVEMLIPSTIDSTLAPQGKHVASLFCQQFNPQLGAKWDNHREEVADLILQTVDDYAPGFTDSIIARQIHSPWDLQQKFALTGGDIFHGRLSLDQLFSARPLAGMAQYQTEIKNIFLCGSGTHPGGGVSGIPGHNAAREIIKSGIRRWTS